MIYPDSNPENASIEEQMAITDPILLIFTSGYDSIDRACII